MSVDAERALQGAVIAALRADAAVAALTGGRVWDEPPREPQHPYLVLSRAESRPWGGNGGEGAEHALTLTCVSRFGGAEEAKAVVAAARACLHDARPAMDGWRAVSLSVAYADVFRGADWRCVLGVLRLRAVTEPLD